MDVEVEGEKVKEPAKEEAKTEADDDHMQVDGEQAGPKPKKKREPEPVSFRLKNPARITTAQSEVCEFDLNQRYRPIWSEEKPFGVIILTDSTPEEEEDLGAVKPPSLEPEGELAPPDPFEWTPPDLSELNEETKEDKEVEKGNSDADKMDE
jgi:26S proteasome regulatory subunit N2